MSLKYLKTLRVIEVLFRARAGVSKAWVRQVVAQTLKAEKKSLPMSVLLTGDREIRKINRRFLKHDFATDVVSFDTGDLVVSVEFAKRYARKNKIPYKQELARYLVHGTLHLLGYDDKKKKDHDRMHQRQEIILSRLNGRRPEGRYWVLTTGFIMPPLGTASGSPN